MTDAQKALLLTFPKTDRGMFGEDGSEDGDQAAATGTSEATDNIIEEDFVLAAKKKAKIKQKAMREKRREREAAEGDEELAKKRVRFVNDEEEELGSEDLQDDGSDSDDILYDSEEEDYAQRKFEERKKKIGNSATTDQIINPKEAKAPESFYDIEAEVKKVQKFKPAEGVKFKQFDALGLPVDDGFDYYKYITTDTNTFDTVIEASPDLMEAAMHPKGERFDRDKEDNEMNEEGKCLFSSSVFSFQSLP